MRQDATEVDRVPSQPLSPWLMVAVVAPVLALLLGGGIGWFSWEVWRHAKSWSPDDPDLRAGRTSLYAAAIIFAILWLTGLVSLCIGAVRSKYRQDLIAASILFLIAPLLMIVMLLIFLLR